MIEMPTWLAMLPKNAYLEAREFAKALGITVDALNQRHTKGAMDFPRCDFKSRGGVSCTGKPKIPRQRWKAVTVRNYIRYLNRKELEKVKWHTNKS